MIGKQVLVKIKAFSIVKASGVSTSEISIIKYKKNTGNYFNPKSLAMILFQGIICQFFPSPSEKQEKNKNVKRQKDYISNVHALGVKSYCERSN